MGKYLHERNFGCRIWDDLTYKGLKTLILENELLRITILVDKGTDILEFLYKPYDIDFMFRSPLGVKNPGQTILSRPPSTGNFLDFYQGGWQEIFPAAGRPCVYKGAEFGLHGEVWGIPWKYQILEDSPEMIKVKFWVRTYRTPFYLEKILTLEKNKSILSIDETVINEGTEEMELMWGHHPTFGKPFLDESCTVDVPAQKVIVETDSPKTTRLIPGDVFPWPKGKGKEGQEIDLSKILGYEAKVSDMVYLTDLTDSWYGITNTEKRIGFGMWWSKEVFRHLWFWQVYGGEFGYPWYGRTYCIALEPFSSYPGTLPRAIEEGTQLKVRSGQKISARLLAIAYQGISKVKQIKVTGEVIGI